MHNFQMFLEQILGNLVDLNMIFFDVIMKAYSLSHLEMGKKGLKKKMDMKKSTLIASSLECFGIFRAIGSYVECVWNI